MINLNRPVKTKSMFLFTILTHIVGNIIKKNTGSIPKNNKGIHN